MSGAAAATLRGGSEGLLARIAEAARTRSRVFWIVAGLTVGAAVLRFATLGVQSYHHDEVVTASRILRGSFGHAMDAVGFSESAPPLYYALAWVWTQASGTGDWGLRSLSALAGVAVVPVGYLLGAELRGRRVGLWAAALIAVNPMLLWYSQEARCYSLLVLLSALALLFCVRAWRDGRRRDVLLFGLFSGLALATHYFAVFPLVAEVAFLLRRRGRAALPGLAVLAGFAAALAPLALHQMSAGHAEWIDEFSLGHRLAEAAGAFVTGETADIIGQPDRPQLWLLPLALCFAGFALLAWRGTREDRRAAGLPVLAGVAGLGIPLAIALLSSGEDYILARNLLPALVPLLLVVAIAVAAPRARRLGTVLGAVLVAYSLGFCVWASASPSLQRPDWKGVAARIGEPKGPRAMVLWTLGEAPLRFYLSTGAFQVRSIERYPWLVREIDFVSDGDVPPPPPHLLGRGFVLKQTWDADRLQVRRYVRRGPGLARLPLRAVREYPLGWRTNGVLIDGVGPG